MRRPAGREPTRRLSKLPSYRYKLTVVVDTSEGPRTGSVVREVRAHSEPHLLPEMGGIYVEAVGEAVFVELPHGKVLVGLLDSHEMGAGPEEIGARLRDAVPDHPSTYEHLAEALGNGDYKTVLAPGDYPIFVTFTDMRDPTTAEEVTPRSVVTLLGRGVHIREIDLASTREPVTHQIVTRLPWLSKLDALQSIPLRHHVPDLPTQAARRNLNKSDFILE